MGFTDEDFFKVKQALNETFYNGNDRSNSQLYKLAGNSISVPMLEFIFCQMFDDNDEIWV
jgi:DNA (cytosine-5)-methyltransferase 1